MCHRFSFPRVPRSRGLGLLFGERENTDEASSPRLQSQNQVENPRGPPGLLTPPGDRDGRQRDPPQGEASGAQQLSGAENASNAGANAEIGYGVQERDNKVLECQICVREEQELELSVAPEV